MLVLRPHAPERRLYLAAPAVRFVHAHVSWRVFVPQYLAKMRNGLAPAGQVDVATIRPMPRETLVGYLVVLAVRLLAIVVGAPDGRFSEVVDARPHTYAAQRGKCGDYFRVWQPGDGGYDGVRQT